MSTRPAPAEGTYVYTVAAFDNAGNSSLPSAGRTIIVDGTPPPVPAEPRRRAPDQHQAGAELDVGRRRRRLRASRATTSTATARSPGPPPATSFTDAGLAVNGSFSYTVRAVDVAGNESAASVAAAIVWDNVAPPAPTGLTGATVVTTAPHLDWFSGGPDGLAGLDHYDVYRGGVLIGSSGSTSYDDAGVAVDGTTSTP